MYKQLVHFTPLFPIMRFLGHEMRSEMIKVKVRLFIYFLLFYLRAALAEKYHSVIWKVEFVVDFLCFTCAYARENSVRHITLPYNQAWPNKA